MSYPKVAVVLLNYCGADDTIECIASVKQADYPLFHIIVVDNASGDQSVERIQHAHSDVTLIQSPENLGFSGGCNLGIKKALEDGETCYIWLLNNDTVIDSQALRALVDMAQNHPKALVGSLILYPDGRYQRVGNRFDPFRGHLIQYREHQLRDGQEVASLTGCSMLIPRQVFETVGYLDEQYFLYFEDNEYCYRARNAGFQCRVALKSKVFHKEGATTGQNKPLVTYYYQRNRLLFAKRYVSALDFKLIEWYTHYRLLRSSWKAKCTHDTDKFNHHRAFQLAVSDFYQGITGRCSHTL